MRRAVWCVAVVVAWAGSLLAAATIDEELYLAAGIPLTIGAGLLLDRWWAAAVPFAVLVVVFSVAVINDPECSDCGEDPWGLQAYYGLAVFAVPASVAMALGVGARRLGRFVRGLDTAADQDA